MFDRLKVWAYNQNPMFWENVGVALFVIVIGIVVGVN